MARRLRWKELLIGIVAFCAVIAGAMAILVFGRVGRLHGKTMTVYVTSDGARGVITGTEVWLDGQKVGLVKNVSFRPPSVKPSERVVIKVQMLESARQSLRLDSKVDIRAGTSIIGDQVVYLSSGTAKMRAISPGDTIGGGKQTDVEEVASSMEQGAREITPLLANVKLLVAQLHTTEGTLGAFGVDQGGTEMKAVRAKSGRLLTRMFNSHGSLSLAMGPTSEITSRATLAMARVDSIRALLGSDHNELGRFRRDSTLTLEIGRVRSELAEVQRLAGSPTGTIGRMRGDSVIVRNVHRDLAAMDSLFAAVKKHPLHYIVF